MKTMKKFIVSLFIIVLFSNNVQAGAENHWAKEEINRFKVQNVIKGYGDGSIKPDNYITRAEFINILNNLLEENYEGDIDYKDLKKEKWYYRDFVNACKSGYLKGYSNNTIRPEQKITREEVATILFRCFKMEVVEEDIIFKDKEEISEWAINAVNSLEKKGYIKGYQDGAFKGKNNITRAEAIKICSNIIEEFKEKIIENKTIRGNIIVSRRDTLLKDLNIEGNIYVTNSAKGYIKFENVRLRGKIFIFNGSNYNLISEKSDLGQVVSEKEAKGEFRIDGGTNLTGIDENTSIKLIRDKKLIIDRDKDKGNVSVNSGDTGGSEAKTSSEIKKIENLKEEVIYVGDKLSLPEKVTVTFINGESKKIKVNWEKSELHVGENIVSGSLETYGNKVDIRIIVREREDLLELDLLRTKIEKNGYINILGGIKDGSKKEHIQIQLNSDYEEYPIHLDEIITDVDGSFEYEFFLPEYVEVGKHRLVINCNGELKEVDIDVINSLLELKDLDKLPDIEIEEGEELVISSYIKTRLSNGEEREFYVEWDLDKFNNMLPGEYEIEGKIEGFMERARLKILVRPKEIYIKDVMKLEPVTFFFGEEIKLAEYVDVRLSNNKVEQREVVWEKIDIDNSKPGDYKIRGKIKDFKEDIVLRVFVEEEGRVDLKFNYESVIVEPGKFIPSSGDLLLEVEGIDEKDIKKVEIKSDNTQVVSITQRPDYLEGGFTKLKTRAFGKAIKEGHTYIRGLVTTNQNRVYETKIEVFVQKKDNVSLDFNYLSYSALVGEDIPEEGELILSTKGIDSKDIETVEIKSSDESIVSISQIPENEDYPKAETRIYGKALKEGDIKLLAIVTSKSGKRYEKELRIEVDKNIRLRFNYDSYTVYPTEYIPKDGDLILSVDGIDSEDIESVEIKSSDESIVAISQRPENEDYPKIRTRAYGKALKLGEVEILGTIRTKNGKVHQSKMKVIVENKNDFDIDDLGLELTVYDSSFRGAGPMTFLVTARDLDEVLYYRVILDNRKSNIESIGTDYGVSIDMTEDEYNQLIEIEKTVLVEVFKDKDAKDKLGEVRLKAKE